MKTGAAMDPIRKGRSILRGNGAGAISLLAGEARTRAADRLHGAALVIPRLVASRETAHVESARRLALSLPHLSRRLTPPVALAIVIGGCAQVATRPTAEPPVTPSKPA